MVFRRRISTIFALAVHKLIKKTKKDVSNQEWMTLSPNH